jgi:hypothetical protein
MRRTLVPAGLLATAALAALLPACSWQGGGHFTILGYSTRPNYPDDVRTVRVPIFQNKTYRQGVEFELTQAVVEAIERYTPFKVVNCDGPADTELKGTIVMFTRQTTLGNQVNEARQAEVVLLLEVVWMDLRTGEERSRPARRPGEPPRLEGPGTPPIIEAGPLSQRLNVPNVPTVPSSPLIDAAPNNPDALPKDLVILPGRPEEEPPKAKPIQVKVSAPFIPEMGQTFGSAQSECCRRASLHIIRLMEKGW